MALPPSSVVHNAASAVNPCRRPVATAVRTPPYSSAPLDLEVVRQLAEDLAQPQGLLRYQTPL